MPALAWPGVPGEFLGDTLARLSRRPTEALFVSLHDARGRYLASREFEGSGSTITLPFRAIIETAIANRASGLLLAHNHPSGEARPSQADIASTLALMALCGPLELALHDHLVVGRHTVVSLRRAGHMEPQRKAA